MTSSHENGQQISSSKKLVSIIAPVYNEEAVIEEFIARLINTVAIITPVFTHYELAKKTLENGKHIFAGKTFYLQIVRFL
jgi:predicted dehydrogenase